MGLDSVCQVQTHLAIGAWDAGGYEFEVIARPIGLAVRYPEAPAGFETPLVELGDGRFLLERGPFGGAELRFALDEEGMPSGSVAGLIPLRPLDRPAHPPPGSGLSAPHLDVDASTEDIFTQIWSDATGAADGRILDHDAIRPAHRFVQWLMTRDSMIFHGSNLDDIDLFQPIRRSMEVGDLTGRGNLGAVYGTHDGLWAMFFAVIDRNRLEGTIRNGVSRFESITGEQVDLYHFSIHRELVALRPFTSGALYLMPREPFQRLPMYPGGPASNEWACHVPVRPLARIPVTPADFPFLDDIAGHDDGPIIAFGRLGDEIYDGVVSARHLDGGFEMVTTVARSTVDRFVELGHQFYPDVIRVATDHPDGTAVWMNGSNAFLHGIEARLRGFLDR